MRCRAEQCCYRGHPEFQDALCVQSSTRYASAATGLALTTSLPASILAFMAEEAVKRKREKPKTPPKEDSPRRSSVLDLVEDLFTIMGDVALLTGRSIRTLIRYGVHVGDLLRQMATVGVDSVWIVAIISAASGAVFALYTAKLAINVGATIFVGGTLGYAYLNELGPVLGGVAFAARSGAAIAAEIGTMVVTEQVDALRAMAVSPVRYLVLPRVLAALRGRKRIDTRWKSVV